MKNIKEVLVDGEIPQPWEKKIQYCQHVNFSELNL